MINSIQQYLNKHGFEKIRLKAVLFDMDGVLFDSMPKHVSAWQEAVKKYGMHLTAEETYLHEGRTAKTTVNDIMMKQFGRCATDEEVKEIYDYKIKIYNQDPTTLPMPGALDFIRKLQKDGIQIILVTGSGQVTLMDRLAKHYPGVFSPDVMVTGKNVKYGKPKPEPYLKGLKFAGNIAPWEAIVIENAPLGVQAGVAANIFTVAVNTGPLEDHYLTDEGANLLLHSMQELSDCWEELRKHII